MRKRGLSRVARGVVLTRLAVAASAAPARGEEGAARCWRYERMRPADLAEAAKERPIAWLVVSPLEWHGEGFDEASVLGGVGPGLVDRGRFGVVERERKVALLRENVDRIDYDKGRRVVEYRAAQLEKRVAALAKELGLGSPDGVARGRAPALK